MQLLSTSVRKSILKSLALIVLGFSVTEFAIYVSSLNSAHRPNLDVIFVGWALGYLFLIWGAAAIILLILIFEDAVLGYLIPALFKGSSYLRRLCIMALDLDDSFVAILAQFTVALLMNLLLLFILFSPAVLRYLIPPIEMTQSNLTEMLTRIRTSFFFAVFLWFVPGTFGPVILYGVKYARVRGFMRRTRHIVSVIQSICYLSILAACLELASGFIGVGIINPTVLRFFVNIFAGLVIPSTFAGIAVMRFFKPGRHLEEAITILLFSLLIVISTYFVFGTANTDAGQITIFASAGLVCLATGQALNRHFKLRRKR